MIVEVNILFSTQIICDILYSEDYYILILNLKSLGKEVMWILTTSRVNEFKK